MLAKDESGAAAIECGLIVALNGVFIITSVSAAVAGMSATFDDIKSGLGMCNA